MIRGVILLLGLLVGCAGPLSRPETNAPADAAGFAIDARFSLRVEIPGDPVQQWSGRLRWQHAPQGDSMLFADPLGQGVAELVSDREGARLRLASGEILRAASAEQLLADRLGFPLPLARLPDWLRARPGGDGRPELDAQGRLRFLDEQGWRIDYAYEDDRARLPSRLIVRRGDTLELRLRIEEWQ